VEAVRRRGYKAYISTLTKFTQDGRKPRPLESKISKKSWHFYVRKIDDAFGSPEQGWRGIDWTAKDPKDVSQPGEFPRSDSLVSEGSYSLVIVDDPWAFSLPKFNYRLHCRARVAAMSW
jgi:hypothetical protein